MPNACCQNDEVVSFVFRNIIPPELLEGSPFQRISQNNVYRFVKSRRIEKFSPKQCMQQLRISKFPLLANKLSLVQCFCSRAWDWGWVDQSTCATSFIKHKSLSYQANSVGEVDLLVLCTYCDPCCTSQFVCHQRKHGKQNWHYYQKSVWNKPSDRVTVQSEGRLYCFLCSPFARVLLSNK